MELLQKIREFNGNLVNPIRGRVSFKSSLQRCQFPVNDGKRDRISFEIHFGRMLIAR